MWKKCAAGGKHWDWSPTIWLELLSCARACLTIRLDVERKFRGSRVVKKFRVHV